MYTHILVPHDGTRLSEGALVHALKLAGAIGARVSVLHVITDFVGEAVAAVPMLSSAAGEAYQQRAIADAEAILAGALRTGRAHDVPTETRYVLAADPHKAIVDVAERSGADLIVMASHGRRGLESLLIGSETQKVLTHCRVPVLVVRS
jgi:nucleotide-binding universal stress UspA family protein